MLLRQGDASSEVVYRNAGSGSGGYAACVLASAAHRLFPEVDRVESIDTDPRILIRLLGNADMQVPLSSSRISVYFLIIYIQQSIILAITGIHTRGSFNIFSARQLSSSCSNSSFILL